MEYGVIVNFTFVSKKCTNTVSLFVYHLFLSIVVLGSLGIFLRVLFHVYVYVYVYAYAFLVLLVSAHCYSL